MQIQSKQTVNMRIFRNLGWMIGFVLIAKCAGAAKEMAIAWRYGTTSVVDAYLFAMSFLNWWPLITTGIFAVVLVPMSTRLQRIAKPEEDQFYAELMGLSLLSGVVAAAVLLLVSRFPSLMPGGLKLQTPAMLLMLAALSPFLVITGLLAARLMSREKFAGSLIEALPAGALIVFVLLIDNLTVPLILGTWVGSLLALLATLLYARRHCGIMFPSMGFYSPHWATFWSGFGVTLIGVTLMSGIPLVDSYMLGEMGKGAIATLGYANRVVALIVTLGATAISRSILPVLSEMALHSPRVLVIQIARSWSIILFIAACTGCLLIYFMAPWVVKLLFERGAFLAKNTGEVTSALRWSLVQLPFYFSAIVLVQLFASFGRYDLIAYSAGLNLSIKIIANIWLQRSMGINGIALAYGIMYGIGLLFFIINLYRLQRQ